MNIYPSLPSRLRFALASTLARLAVCVLPYAFARRFSEETNELLEEKISDQWMSENEHLLGEGSARWTQDGTQRID